MITLRKSSERGTTKTRWLDSRHTFSFNHYHDPQHMGFGPLRVINEDWIAPDKGFGTHPHHDMEILTYVMEGTLEHKDSLGTGSVIAAGDVQRMSAGTGILHSESNPEKDSPVHLLQIWILPEQAGIPPGYEQKNFSHSRKPGKLTLLAARDGREGSLTVHQDAEMYVLDLAPGQSASYVLAKSRMVWVQMARGSATISGHQVNQGDAAAITDEHAITFTAGPEPAEAIIFDLSIP